LRNGEFERIGARPGTALAQAWCARGIALGDLDGDGRLDVVINNIDSKPTILKNVATPVGHWLELRLAGDPAKKSPGDAIGAIAYLTIGKLRLRQDVVSGGSYASQNDMTLHFGLGAATSVDKLEIKWPDGTSETVSVPGVDRKLTMIQSKGVSNR
jgi:hypothetical protein